MSRLNWQPPTKPLTRTPRRSEPLPAPRIDIAAEARRNIRRKRRAIFVQTVATLIVAGLVLAVLGGIMIGLSLK